MLHRTAHSCFDGYYTGCDIFRHSADLGTTYFANIFGSFSDLSNFEILRGAPKAKVIFLFLILKLFWKHKETCQITTRTNSNSCWLSKKCLFANKKVLNDAWHTFINIDLPEFFKLDKIPFIFQFIIVLHFLGSYNRSEKSRRHQACVANLRH